MSSFDALPIFYKFARAQWPCTCRRELGWNLRKFGRAQKLPDHVMHEITREAKQQTFTQRVTFPDKATCGASSRSVSFSKNKRARFSRSSHRYLASRARLVSWNCWTRSTTFPRPPKNSKFRGFRNFAIYALNSKFPPDFRICRILEISSFFSRFSEF